MNLFNRVTSLGKLAVLVIATSISFFISIPTLAKTNPRPSIFKEFPYNRSSNRRVKRPKYKIKYRPNARLKKQPATARNYRKPSYKQPIKQDENVQRVIEFRAPGVSE